VVLMQQTGAGNDAGSRAVLIDELGDILEQSLDRQPNIRLEAGIKGGVLLLESPLAPACGSHSGPVIFAAAPSIPPWPVCKKEPESAKRYAPTPAVGVRAYINQCDDG
jgi:hypothetical protein